jgi:hypothetical protein
MDRNDYLAKYREDNRAYFAQKSREQYEEGKKLYGRQARVATRKWFVGEPVVGMSMVRKKVVITFD